VKEDVAKKHLQKSNRKALEALAENLAKEIEAELRAGNISKVENIAKKYNMKMNKEARISLYEPKASDIDFEKAKLAPIFENKSQEVIVLKELPYYKFLKIQSFAKTKDINETIEKNLVTEKKTLEAEIASSFQFSLVKE